MEPESSAKKLVLRRARHLLWLLLLLLRLTALLLLMLLLLRLTLEPEGTEKLVWCCARHLLRLL